MNYKYILAISFAALAFSSCGDDFLGKEPQGALNPEDMASATGVDLLTINAYAGLAARVDDYDPYQASPFNWVWGGIYGGDANKGSDPGDQSVVNEIELYNTMATNGYIEQKWVWVYSVAKRTNLALQALAGAQSDMPEADYKSRLGELKFIRALVYFEGTRVFGPYLPWIDETFLENDPKVHNDTDIRPHILADIDEAIANLPETQAEAGRANVWAAKALKAKILMHQQDMASARPILKEVLERGVTSKGEAYGLEDDLDTNFNALTENGKESVFAVQYSVGVNDRSIAVDPRLDFAVGRYGVPYKDWGLPKDDWVRNPVNGGIFLPKKHVLSKAEEAAGMKALYDGWAPGSCMNMQYLSLRDLILLYAECLADAGQMADAMAEVNKVRARAALDINVVKLADGTPAANYKIALYPSSHPAFSDREVCIKAVRMERKLELAMEGERWFDLVRWGGDLMSAELKAYINYEKNYIPKFAAATVLPPSKTMLPVPDNQVLTMGNDENGQPYLVQPDPWK